MLGLQAVQFLGAVVEETVVSHCCSCAGFAVAVLLRGRCPCCAGSSRRPALDQVVDVPVVVQRQGFSQWKCLRYSSSPVDSGHSSCATQTGTTFPATLLMAAMMGFLTHFASFFALLRLCPELSASFSSLSSAHSSVSARGLPGVPESPGV